MTEDALATQARFGEVIARAKQIRARALSGVQLERA